jgi:hypothetical protein
VPIGWNCEGTDRINASGSCPFRHAKQGHCSIFRELIDRASQGDAFAESALFRLLTSTPNSCFNRLEIGNLAAMAACAWVGKLHIFSDVVAFGSRAAKMSSHWSMAGSPQGRSILAANRA